MLKSAFALLSAAAFSVVVLSAQDAPKRQRLIGTWRIKVTIPAGSSACPAGPNPCVFVALANVHKDGTAIQTAALPGTSTGHGVWSRTGPNSFQLRTTYFRLGPDGFPIGTAETTSAVTVSETGSEASGTYENKVFDVAGAQIGSFSAAVTGARMVR